MVSKSISLLKKNPVIILFYAVYLIAILLIVLTIYPKDMSQFANPKPGAVDFAALMIAVFKMLVATLLMGIIGLLFFSGFGGMISEAVLNDKTYAASFLAGLKKFFVRFLLASLLFLAFYIGFSIVLSIILIPITLITAANGVSDITSVKNTAALVSTSISSVAVIFSFPFILLWPASIFIDDTGVIQGLKNGAKAGVKNYWKLVLVLIAMCIPVAANMIINWGSISKGVVLTPGYAVICFLTAVISIIALPVIFIIYKDYRPVQIKE